MGPESDRRGYFVLQPEQEVGPAQDNDADYLRYLQPPLVPACNTIIALLVRICDEGSTVGEIMQAQVEQYGQSAKFGANFKARFLQPATSEFTEMNSW